jgi:YYY domain-containing protein
MTSFFVWYFIIAILGWLTFPLTHYLFPTLADRGYTLSRAAGLLIWGYVFWLLASLGIAQNDMGGILLALTFIVGLSLWSIVQRPSAVLDFIKSNVSLVITTEVLFLIAFAFLAFVRSANPELNGTERPMELMFINSILRSPVFPPQDGWLSGYAISYYYFGYVMTAMLARLSGINGSMAHNLMTSLIFALGAIGAYGILYNLLSRLEITNRKSQVGSALFAPLFLLLVSNFGALLEILHQGGLFWKKDAVTGEYTSSFWKWLDMQELSRAPAEPFHFLPLERYLWWWRSSRVIQDYDMVGGFKEVIDEFPFFSFLLGDLHPHVLAIPFSLLAIAVALNLFLGGWRGEINLPWGARLHVNYAGFLFSALVIGGMAFLNTWDILVSATLIVAAYVLWRANEDGWNWNRLEELFVFALPLGILSILLYLPFYLGFSSQAGGILPNFMYPTRGVHLWMMWGTLLIPIFAYLLYLIFGRQPQVVVSDNDLSEATTVEDNVKPNWKRGLLIGFGFVLFLWLLSLLLAWLGTIFEKDFVNSFLVSQGMTASEFFGATSLRRLSYIGSLITLLAIFIPALAFLFSKNITATEDEAPSTAQRSLNTSYSFVFLILTLGTVLVLAPEFVYLRDQFGYRINTVFKFYYQAWMLWSLTAAFAVAYLFQNLGHRIANISFRVLMGIVIFIGLLYPALCLLTKTNNFQPPYGFTLDDFFRIKRENPDEAAAIEFLKTQPDGVVAESIGDGYSAYGRISMFTGLQTVLGWKGHEAQWRGSYEPQGTRNDDIIKLYTTARWEEADLVIKQYNIRYIYIGMLEFTSMNINEEKFQANLKPIFQQGNVVIYEVPQ